MADPTQTTTDTIFLVAINIANLIGILYNIPQMIHTYKLKSTRDISKTFINLRIVCSIIWLVYSIYYAQWSILVSWVSTFVSGVWLEYYAYVYPRLLARRQHIQIQEQLDSAL